MLVLSFLNRLAIGSWDIPTIVILLSALLLVITYVVYDFKSIKGFLRIRATQYISNALVASLLFVGIFIMINYVFSKHNIRIDLTENQTYTLSAQTIKILENLDSEIKITAFSVLNDKVLFEDIVSEYQFHSGKVNFTFYDLDKNPEIAKNFDVQVYGTIFLESQGRSVKIFGIDEQTLANALIKVTRKEQKVIYFLTGHGESDIESTDPGGFKKSKESIVNVNFEVKTVNLARDGAVPGDCSLLIINGPQTELFPDELTKIDNFINRGGRVLFMLDPEPSPGMNKYFAQWGITVGNDLIIDNSGRGQAMGYPPSVPLITDYNHSHPIVRDFNLMTFFVMSRSVTPRETQLPEGVSVEWLVRTDSKSWGEVDYQWDSEKPEEQVKVGYEAGKDLSGPVTIASVVTKFPISSPGITTPPSLGQMVVFGDSDFARNSYADPRNTALFMNTVNWLAEEEDLVAIPPKNPEDRRVAMTANQATFTLYLTVFFIPGLLIFFGLSVFFRRRGL